MDLKILLKYHISAFALHVTINTSGIHVDFIELISKSDYATTYLLTICSKLTSLHCNSWIIIDVGLIRKEIFGQHQAISNFVSFLVQE